MHCEEMLYKKHYSGRYIFAGMHPLAWILLFALAALILGAAIAGLELLLLVGGFVTAVYVVGLALWLWYAFH